MSIFRCFYCDDVFDFSLQYLVNDLPFCGKCQSTYREKLKPKITSTKYHELPSFFKEEDYEPELVQRKKK